MPATVKLASNRLKCADGSSFARAHPVSMEVGTRASGRLQFLPEDQDTGTQCGVRTFAVVNPRVS